MDCGVFSSLRYVPSVRLSSVVITGSLIRSKLYYDMMSSTFDHAEENVVNDKAEG
jgi:hypothetical protein